MAYVLLCDYCGQKITEERVYAITLTQQRTMFRHDVSETKLCTWDCVVAYAMRCGGIDPHPTS